MTCPRSPASASRRVILGASQGRLVRYLFLPVRPSPVAICCDRGDAPPERLAGACAPGLFCRYLLLAPEEERLISQWQPYDPYEPFFRVALETASAAVDCDCYAARGTIDQLACRGACRGFNRRPRRRSPRCTSARTVCNFSDASLECAASSFYSHAEQRVEDLAATPENSAILEATDISDREFACAAAAQHPRKPPRSRERAASLFDSHAEQRVEDSFMPRSDSRTRSPLETPGISERVYACAAVAQCTRKPPRSCERTASISLVRHCSAAYAAYHLHRLGAMCRACVPVVAYHPLHGAMRALLPAETARPPGVG